MPRSADKPPPTVSVVVPARDAARHIPALTSALASQDGIEQAELVLVDNGSLDDTAALAVESGVFDEVVRRERGEGAGAARNAGASRTSGRLLAFLDADCRPAEGWLGAGVAAATAAELVLGRVLPEPGVIPGPFDRTLAVTEDHGLFESANLFVARTLFESLGGFPGGLEPARDGRAGAPFGEDCLFGWAARRAGARTAFCEGAVVHHAVLPGDVRTLLAERARLRMFPALVREVPELRDALLGQRLFLTRRNAALHAALLGLGAALRVRNPLPAAAAVPYARMVTRRAMSWGLRAAPRIAAVDVLADLRGAGALVSGSLRARTLVL